jgi:heterotetrameric sarcosine oxidase gamma subunit
MSGPTTSPGVIATSRDTLAIVRVNARRGRVADLTRTVRERFDIDLPVGPRRVQSGSLAFIGIGVDAWLATTDAQMDGFAASLRNVVDESATVSDQIGAYHVLRLTGRHVADVLAKLVSLDLHPKVFEAGCAATTSGSHIPMTLWRLAQPDAFELAVPRSYSHDFTHLLAENAAEFGFAKG